MPNARQSDLANRPTYLPPLSPSARSHPHHHHTNVPPLQSYPVKLASDVVKALLNCEDAVIQFNQDEPGKIFIPNHPDVTFATRAITAHNADTARAALFSRRASSLRLVGPINYEMEIDRFPNQRSHVVKKRTVNSRNPTKREMKPSESSQETPAAKRARKTVEKRPRAQTKPPIANSTSTNNASGLRIRRSVPAPLPPPLRSAPASPTENGRQNVPKRSTLAARNSIGALGARRTSPPSNTQLPKPVSRNTPTKARQSPHSSSRGPSPNEHSPSSPRVSTRRKMDDPEDVRRHVVHSLALGPMTIVAIRRRHEACNMESTVLDGALGEVAEKGGSTYRLKKRSWREVYDDYTEYSEMDKKTMVQNRFKAGAVDGKLATEVMNDHMFEHEVNDMTKHISKSVTDAKDEEEDDKLRKNYYQVHKLYKEVIERVTDVGIKFQRLEDKWVSCGESEMAHLNVSIQSANNVYSERFFRLQRLLPKLHGYLKQVRQAVVRYAQWEE